MRIKTGKRLCGLLQNAAGRFSAVVFLCAMAPHTMAANKGNISAAVTTLIIGAILSVLIAWVFSLKKTPEGHRSGIKMGLFFLLLSVLLLIVFVAGTAAFFVFM